MILVGLRTLPTTAFSLWQQSSHPRRGSDRRTSSSCLYGHFSQPPLEWDTEVLQYRLNQLRRQALEAEFSTSIRNIDNPIAFVETCLHRLQHNDDPFPDSGIRFLLHMSTKSWRQQIRQSVGAPTRDDSSTASLERVVAAVSAAMAQPDNQYALLLQSPLSYRAVFPSDPLIFPEDDVTDARSGWVECQLRHPESDQLLVSMGWQLRSDMDQEWRMERIDWQDFREPFRPGVGREEWMRICG
jgi:hypothetical protein